MLSPWQERARWGGLSQRTIALLLGHSETYVSLAIRRGDQVPRRLRQVILMWARLSPQDRADILIELDLWRERGRQSLLSPPEREKPLNLVKNLTQVNRDAAALPQP